ncbi:hypothetical protein [Streptomyces hydrogenans]|uniref:hypothetical protein n=1 Tax=Streptomyces hydrogenans TaxID=1873719 RepID=UPI001CFF1CFB|nr:hypothetical protein [Streptomyces hydrogenans]
MVDAETLALLDELDVPLPVDLTDAEVDLDIAFGTAAGDVRARGPPPGSCAGTRPRS